MTLPSFINGQKLFAEQLQAIVSAIPTDTGQLTNGGQFVNVGQLATYATLASPTFTGIPKGPTAQVGTNTTQLATCEFVLANGGSGGSSVVSGTNPTFTGTITFQNLTTTQPADGSYQIYDNNGTLCIASPGNGSSGGGSGSTAVVQSISSGSAGLTITGAANTPTLTLLPASTTILGSVKVDGTTIVINGGVISGNLPIRVMTASGAITVATADRYVIVNKTTGAASAVTLPASPTTGMIITVKDGKGDGSTNNLTVSPATGTIDGSATYVMNSNYQSQDFIYNGTQWNKV